MATPGTISMSRIDWIRRLGIYWAIDNQVFGGQFDEEKWLTFLEDVPSAAKLTCLFAVAPDVLHRRPDGSVYGDPVATLERSSTYFETLRAMRYRIGFVCQDGATDDLIPWNEIDALFIGGSDEWKLSLACVKLIRKAQRLGLWTHMGRCQARATLGGRFGASVALGIDSSDGTVLVRDPSRLPRIFLGLDQANDGRILPAVIMSRRRKIKKTCDDDLYVDA